jgi:uncharacterized protein (DUF2164 family)
VCFRCFTRWFQTKFNINIKIIRSNNGGEYMSNDLGLYFCEQGTIHQTTYVNTP